GGPTSGGAGRARGGPEADLAVRPVTERLVLRSAAPAQGRSGVLADQVSARVLDADLPPDEQGTVGTQLHRRLGLRFLGAAVEAPEVQRAGRASHDDLGALVGGRLV